MVLTVAVVLVSRLKPAAPTVDASTVWPDTVKRGDMIRQVRGSTGTLVPREDSIELIPALTDATVVRIRVLPGTIVKPDTILMDLAAPEVEQKLLDAQAAGEAGRGRLQEPAGAAAKHPDGQEDRCGAGCHRLHAGPAAGRDRRAALQARRHFGQSPTTSRRAPPTSLPRSTN